MLLRAAVLLFLTTTAQSITLNIKHHSNGKIVSVAVDDQYIWGANPQIAKAMILEVKAFDCAPCRVMDTNVTSYVKDYFYGNPDVAIALKVGRVGERGDSAIKKAYCGMKLGAVLDTVKRILFFKPLVSSQDFSNTVMIDEGEYSSCLISQEALNFKSEELKDISSIGTPYYPSLWLNGSFYRTNGADSLIRDIEAIIKRSKNHVDKRSDLK